MPVPKIEVKREWVVIEINTVTATFNVFGPYTRSEADDLASESPAYTVRKLRAGPDRWYCRQDTHGYVRVWEEGWPGDAFDVMSIKDAIAKRGPKIRFLFESQDNNSDWDGETYLTE